MIRNLPDPLVMSDGTPVKTKQEWALKRRPELLELFRTYVYGRMPVGRPANMRFDVKVTPDAINGRATRKDIAITFKGSGGEGVITFVIFVPKVSMGPVPSFLLTCDKKLDIDDPDGENRSEFWPVVDILGRGYGAVLLQRAQIDPDNYDGFKDGVHGIFDTVRTGDSWGTIAAWAWGASRVMDYLETDRDFDSAKVAIVGQSRGGKTALWAAAEDERFQMAISNNSGCTGAAISRGKHGESVSAINAQFPHWFCGNYHKYGGREDDLPVDQHELLALIAPRFVYVASAAEDSWADPESEFLSCVEASPVYSLFGLDGIAKSTMLEPGNPIYSGSIGYHLRPGGHKLTLYDWTQFMDFADSKWR